jgi:hypothetical protein
MEVKIRVDELRKFTKKDFVMQYLFRKSEGNRSRGEAATSELFKGWVAVCEEMGKKPGKSRSFQHEMWTMKEQGIVEVKRQESSTAPAPKNFYILTVEYFEYMRKESR